MEDQRVKEILIEKNENFKKLFLRHQEYDKKLKKLNINNFKSDKDLIEIRKLKKKKLALKDRMQKHILDYKRKIKY